MNMRFPADTDRKTIVTRKYTLIYSLVIFCSLSSFASPRASSATCTPVVYAFRYAEDIDTALTPVGMEHANLYIEMIKSLEFNSIAL
jgi:hypothetical protein